MSPAPIGDVLRAIATGQRVVVIEEDTEDASGCVLVAADQVSEADVNFMAAHARGLVCLAITESRRRQLGLPMMAGGSRQGRRQEPFTVSIEAVQGVSTGISAADRALTMRVATAANAGPGQLVQPGHVFPVVAQPDGVLRSAGFAEACSDLPRLAGREAAGAYTVLLDDAGELLRGAALLAFAREHGLLVCAISDLIHHRLLVERALRRSQSSRLATPFGDFIVHAYHDAPIDAVHLALVLGQPDPAEPVLTRVQTVETLRDLFAFESAHAAPPATPGWNLARSLARIGEEGCGILVLLAEREAPHRLLEQLALLDQSGPTWQTARPAFAQRALGVGAQILRDLGVRKLRLLGVPVPYRNIAGFELEVTGFVPPG
ncbi:3,4-dihydroxy-2-butanone-4-phosphate synthase [Cupriavidus sp. YAF13]|uniref:3,4-dihydroxy-2-butanone-4-phosphate synthase n=1 Tax=Cupriavidus sp. YAF13 TaxID=3233075 RepID=UPI003F925FDC